MGKKQSLNKIYAKYINGDDYLISNETNTPAQDLLSERDIQLLTQNIINSSAPFDIGGVMVCKIDLRCVYLDLGYQTLNRHFACPGKLRTHWDPRRVGLVELNYRNGKLYCIDGGHRIKESLHRGEYMIPAQIHMDLTRAEEAEEFATQNEAKAPLQPMDTYNAWICCKDSGGDENIDSKIRDLVVKYGYTVAARETKDSFRTLTSISSIRAIAKKITGMEAIEWMFDLMRTSKWCVHTGFSRARYMNAFYDVYREALSEDKLDKYTEKSPNAANCKLPTSHRKLGKSTLPKFRTRSYVKSTFLDMARGNIQKSDFVCMFADK